MHPDFTIVIPAFREEGAIGDVVRNLLTSIPKIVDSFELIVIDDGSDDGTAEVAKLAGARVISHPYNRLF